MRYEIRHLGETIDHAETLRDARRQRDAAVYCGIGEAHEFTIALIHGGRS